MYLEHPTVVAYHDECSRKNNITCSSLLHITYCCVDHDELAQHRQGGEVIVSAEYGVHLWPNWTL